MSSEPGRQYRHARLLLGAVAVVMTVALVMAAAMIAMHGVRFFVFRSAGTGATSDDALAEDQGPGQPSQPPAPLLLTAPGGRVLSVQAPGRDTWAGIALTDAGRWGLLAAGPGYAGVRARTARMWARDPAEFVSAWYVVPLRKELTAMAVTPVSPARQDTRLLLRTRGPRRTVLLVLLGAPALLPVAFMLRPVIAYDTAVLQASGNDVLGTGAALLLFATLAVTPACLMTGQRWFAGPLRQWYGVMFAVTVIFDGILAAADPGFAGGVAGRLAGHAFLLLGTTMVLLSVPLLATANRASMKWLGRYWKPVQKYGTYGIWGLLAVHLSVLEGFGYDSSDRFGVLHQRLYQVLSCSLLLVTMRLPPVKAWVRERQRAGKGWQVRLAIAPLLLLFAVAYFFLVNEELRKGIQAFILHVDND